MSKMKPMNLLVITSDQHNKNMLGCYGNPYVKTPNLDRLADNGVLFQNAYCNSPLCAPSRAAMATGEYISRNGYWDNAHAYGGEVPSWGGRLAEQQHTVTTIGKLHYTGNVPETGFLNQLIPLHIKNGVGDLYGVIRDKEITRKQFGETVINAGAGETDYIRYDRKIAELAAEWLQANAQNNEKPFVLCVNFVTPHFPLIVPQEYLDLYPDEHSVMKPVQFEREQWPDHPVLNNYRKYCGTENIDEEAAYRALRAYYGLCTFMDEQVGLVLDALAQSGLAENTRIIYTSDHGDTMGEHGVYFKSTMYEGSCGVPLIVSGPDLPKNQVNETNVSLVDLFPTIIEGVGAEPHPDDVKLPGQSLWKYAAGEEDKERVVLSEYYSFGIYTAVYMLRKGDFKYVHYTNERPQLFNLAEDPDEINDLAGDDQYQGVIKEMEKELRKIVDVEEMERRSKEDQAKLLEKHGGKDKIIRELSPSLFSPIPNL